MARHKPQSRRKGRFPLAARAGAALALLVAAASCVPAQASYAPAASGLTARPAAAPAPVPADAPPPPPPMVLQDVSPTDAAAINAAIPIASVDNPRAPSVVFRAADAADQLRSLDCLAKAVYYEARSQSEDGQRAVAQVVLNRVRHPAFPSSVCGVVYQGPQRAGGGCQFTFTCDGSLGVAPSGPAWTEARRVAAEALAGQVYAPVGDATHYHTQQVVPAWAFRLAKVAVIGAHSFYRLPGAWGEPGAFRQAYARREPAPSVLMATRLPASIGRAAPPLPVVADTLTAPLPAGAAAPAPSLADERLPVSQVKPEYRNSGRPLSDGPPPSAPGSAGTPSPASTPATRG
ncbi:MAG TPA: cell wall hydrolase [Allosphingosinicella sp.]|jgi:spore germination cell wall hydrolase CwlJ-like protein